MLIFLLCRFYIILFYICIHFLFFLITLKPNNFCFKHSCFVCVYGFSIYIYIFISAVKRLIVINRIQNKSFCLDLCV